LSIAGGIIVPRSRFAVAVLLVVGLGAPAFGQDTVDLKWKFEKGKTFYQEITTDTKQDMKVMGMNIAQNQKQTFIFSWTPEQQNDDKSWVIKQKIEGVKVDIQIGGNPMSFDSTKDTGAANPLADFFKSLVGAEFKMTVSPDMKVTKIEGRDEFLKKLVQSSPQMQPLLNQILSDEALKQMADPAFAVIPNKPVKKGDTWERQTTLSMGPVGSYVSTHKYTFVGMDEKDKNLAKIKVDTSLKYTPPTAGATAGLPFQIASANLESKEATGTVLFDIARGRVSSSIMNLKLDGTIDINIGGMTSQVKLEQTQSTTMKTSDENPVKKPTGSQ
jgi:hypothetical protein